MRAFWLIALVLVISCKKETVGQGSPTAPASTQDLDALWRLAPEGAKVGFVASPRGVAMLERAAIAIQTLLDAAPELAPARDKLAQSLTGEFGSPKFTLAEFGLTADQGFAAFLAEHDEGVLVVPVADRAKFLAKTHGKTDGDHDVIGKNLCKPINDRYVCVENLALLDKLGHGSLDAMRRTAGARGDLEFAGHNFTAASDPTVAWVVQLARGEFVVRGTTSHVPHMVTDLIGSPSRPRAEPSTASGFGVIDVAPYLKNVPQVPLAPGITLADLARTVSGPITFTFAAGTGDTDLRIPLGNPATAKALIEHCAEVFGRIGATVQGGVCHIPIPMGKLELESRVDGNQLRIGYHTPGTPGTAVSMTPSPLATELSENAWSIAIFGRGSYVDLANLPGAEDYLKTILSQYPAEGNVFLRSLPWFSEFGVGVRKDGDVLHFLAGVRTAWANPDDVVAKLLAISGEQVLSGKAAELGKSLASAAPNSPFAQDLKAGAGGMLAVTPLILLPSVGVPAFMDYMKRSKNTEASLQLNKLGKNAKRVYAETAAFPIGEVPLTPEAPCCGGPNNHCVTTSETWQHPVWKALDFEIDEPTLFQYSYQSDGKTFTAKAVGDLDCDGTTITYELHGTSEGGNPAVTLIEPPPNSD